VKISAATSAPSSSASTAAGRLQRDQAKLAADTAAKATAATIAGDKAAITKDQASGSTLSVHL
jgi:hypothetical protein